MSLKDSIFITEGIYFHREMDLVLPQKFKDMKPITSINRDHFFMYNI
jgi:hypothetical protein